MTNKWRGEIAVLGAALAVSSCTANVEPSSKPEGVGVERAALNDPLVAFNGAHTAIATTTSESENDGLLAVWQANAANPQIVGQAFNQNNGMPRGGPAQTYTSNSGLGNSLPAVASEPAFPRYLIVWQRQYSSTDFDILAEIVSDDGTPVPPPVPLIGSPNEFAIENDTLPENSPAVTLVPDSGFEWLVTYTRTENGVTSLLARWVDNNGNVSNPFTVVPSGVHAVPKGRNTISSCNSTNLVMYTYNDNVVAFSDVATLKAGAPSSVSNATGLAGSCNQGTGVNALTWLSGTSKVGTLVLPYGCTSLSCAGSPNYIIRSGTGGITSVNMPVIAPFGQGYGIAAGLHPQALQELEFVQIDGRNNVVASNTKLVPSCTGTIQGALGTTDTIAASTPPDTYSSPTPREFFFYEPDCKTTKPPTHTERVAAPTPDNIHDIRSFDVSD
jgi:hypothetical protein